MTASTGFENRNSCGSEGWLLLSDGNILEEEQLYFQTNKPFYFNALLDGFEFPYCLLTLQEYTLAFVSKYGFPRPATQHSQNRRTAHSRSHG